MVTNGTIVSNDEWLDALWHPDAENKEYFNELAYMLQLLTNVSSMFTRDGLPEGFNDRVIEPILISRGCGAYVKEGDEYFFGLCSLAGEMDKNYYGKDAIVTAGGGYCEYFKDWKENPNIVVCWNTPLRVPDLQVMRTAAVLKDIDTSLFCNLIYSRLYPIGVASDDKTRVTLETLFNKMKVGEFASITSPNILQQITGATDPGISVVNLTDVSVSDKIQYLAKYRDDSLRWFYSLYGQNVQATSKLAQESVAETTSGEGVSMILPHTMYHERQRECEELKRKFGWNVTCEFTEPWQNQFADCFSEDGTADTAEKGNEDGKDNDGGTIDATSRISGNE